MQEYEEDSGGESLEDSPLSLGERAFMIDGLQREEREWIAKSTGDWQSRIESRSGEESRSESRTEEPHGGAGDAAPARDRRELDDDRVDARREHAESHPDPVDPGNTEAEVATTGEQRSRPEPTSHHPGERGGEGTEPETLHDLPELSVAHVRVLGRAGIETPADLVEADVETLRTVTGYDRALLRHWQALARLRL